MVRYLGLDDDRAFPAYAGMNRIIRRHATNVASVPRVCGDEPWSGIWDWTMIERSPRMRG